MAARLSEAVQTQYENLEYCNGRLCAVAAVERADVKADTHEGAGAAPAGTPIGSGARRRCRQRHVEGGQAKPTSRCVSRPLFRDHPRPRSASAPPARNPSRQTCKSFRRTCGSRARMLHQHPADPEPGFSEIPVILRLRREFGLRLPGPPQSLRRLPRNRLL